MNWDAIAAIAEILAATGVVISLFYLGTQIRAQNRESKLAAMHEISEAFRDSYGQFRDGELAEFFVRGNVDFKSLTDVEKVRLFATINPLLKVFEEAFWQFRQGRFDEELWLPMVSQFSFFLAAPTLVQAWEQRRSHYNANFQKFVDDLNKPEYKIH
ncbi:MAG: hypothetical protein V7700_15960 [Halioglobus sp.]